MFCIIILVNFVGKKVGILVKKSEGLTRINIVLLALKPEFSKFRVQKLNSDFVSDFKKSEF